MKPNSSANFVISFLQATAKASAENSNRGEASSSTATDFTYEEEGVHFTFKASPEGYICCFCGNPQKRLMTHLQSKNSLCQGRIISMSTISSSFKSFSNKKKEATRTAKNPESSKERQATFKAKNPERSKEQQATFKAKNPESGAKRVKLCRAGRSPNTTVKRFQEATMYSCIFICACCHLRKFQNQVVLFDEKLMDTFTNKAPTAMKEFVFPEGSEELPPDLYTDIGKGPQAWLCSTCKGYLLRTKMPPNCHKNNLQVKPSLQDDPETALTQLEAHLISRNIQFQFIKPKGRSR